MIERHPIRKKARFARWFALLVTMFGITTAAQADEKKSFVYDALGRLTAVSNIGSINSGLQTNYTLDAAGNRTQVVTADADVAAYFAAMAVQPDATRKGLISALIAGLKADGLWTKIAWLSLLASHTEQAALLNVKVPSKTATAINGTGTFSANLGYTGNGSLYLDAEAPTTSGIYTQNSAFSAFWKNNTAGSILAGQVFTSSKNYLTTGTLSGRINAASNVSSGASFSRGLALITRNSASQQTFYINGGSGITVSSTSAAPANFSSWLFGAEFSYSSGGSSAMWAWGSGLTGADSVNFYNRINTYLTAIGAN
ncbi:MAG: RHS repeat domain-containing protein [Polynucleobacter sp.]|nr:RHS repeat domain-containing protein [Polynucleobacter sp.]